MNAEQELHAAYDEWRRLAEAEGEAIRAANWDVVDDCQAALKKLQPHILHCTEAAQREWSHLQLDSALREETLRAMVDALIEIETRNQASLELQRQTARKESDQLTDSGRTLQRIKRSYVPTQPATWTSFS